LSAGMAPTRCRRSAHDPGRVLRDLIASIADGGDCLADLGVLRGQPELFGEVASLPTAWRVVESITPQRLGVLREARRRARERAWTNGAAPERITLDFDATLVTAHSEKEGAAGNFKGGFGFHPLVCYLDESSEALAGILRPGNAGANTAADHITVLYQALEQLPDPAWGMEILARADSGGATHDFVNVLRELQIRFSCGFDLTEPVREAILATPESAWVPAITQKGEEREGAAVCELTNLDLNAWPEGTRAICRRERPHPGAQLTFTDHQGFRFQVFITDQDDTDLAQLEARHRRHARVEDRIRCGKDTGLRKFPFRQFAANQVWLELVLAAQDLLTFFQRLCLDGKARDWEPKTLRHRLLHVAGRVARSGRRVFLRLQRSWRWASLLATAFRRLHSLPAA
ncbi:MAG TPA: IS1380 family transposase, partial [Myxococcaceae bacterium]|nr:IS1380 family transposase [Myxococcaceae bacterium]